MLLLVDAEIANTGAIAAMEGSSYAVCSRCREFLDETARMLEDGVPLPLPLWRDGKRPSKPGSDYHPETQPHCVTLIGAKDIWGPNARVLYHDPLYGPYREIALRDLYSAAMVPYLQNREELGHLEYIVPVPDDIWFDPIGLTERLGNEYLNDQDLARREPHDNNQRGQTRVRLLHRDKIAAAYLRGRRLRDEEKRALNTLLPSDRRSKHVLCLEWYPSVDSVDRGQLLHVLFAYVSPDGKSFEDGYVTPATGAISIDEDSGEICFTRINPLGYWQKTLASSGIRLLAKDITEL
jgi:hypothetical protein